MKAEYLKIAKTLQRVMGVEEFYGLRSVSNVCESDDEEYILVQILDP